MHFSYSKGMEDVGFCISQSKMLTTFHRERLSEI